VFEGQWCKPRAVTGRHFHFDDVPGRDRRSSMAVIKLSFAVINWTLLRRGQSTVVNI
jgi:hypothetical protein